MCDMRFLIMKAMPRARGRKPCEAYGGEKGGRKRGGEKGVKPNFVILWHANAGVALEPQFPRHAANFAAALSQVNINKLGMTPFLTPHL